MGSVTVRVMILRQWCVRNSLSPYTACIRTLFQSFWKRTANGVFEAEVKGGGSVVFGSTMYCTVCTSASERVQYYMHGLCIRSCRFVCQLLALICPFMWEDVEREVMYVGVKLLNA